MNIKNTVKELMNVLYYTCIKPSNTEGVRLAFAKQAGFWIL